jgi:nitrous oxidase accessory protein
LNRKVLAVGLILVLIGTSVIQISAQDTKKTLPASRGNWLYVGGSGSGNYTRIQDAIDDASNGDTIYVYNGTYYENITLTKPLSLIGEQQQTTIIDGCQHGDVITIISDSATISGFTLRNSSLDMWEHWAINIQKNDFTVSQCIITANNGGIYLYNVSHCNIKYCSIYNNICSSIVIRLHSDNIQIDNSTIFHNGKQIDENTIYNGGIAIDGYNGLCSNLIITNCSIYDNIGDGINLFLGANNISIIQSVINNNSWYGISISRESTNITLHHNTIFENGWAGIFIIDYMKLMIPAGSVHNILINNNTIMSNGNGEQPFADGGIIINSCINGVCIIDNEIMSNNKYGVYLLYSLCNKIINNNFINNTCNAMFLAKSFLNKWIDNYWDDWSGFGPKIIHGKFGLLPWYNFDWHPAQEPYDIPGMR